VNRTVRDAASRANRNVAFLAIAAVALFAAFGRSGAGMPAATLVPDGAASNVRFIVTRAPPPSRLHVGDRVEIDDPRTLAALTYHSLVAGSTVRVRRIGPVPADVEEPVVVDQRPAFAIALVPLELVFFVIAAFIAAKGRAAGSLSLAWLLACIVLIANPTTPAWPRWLIVAFAIGGVTISVAAFFFATDFATRLAGDPDAQWARRLRRSAFVVASIVLVISLAVGADTYFAPATPPIAGARIWPHSRRKRCWLSLRWALHSHVHPPASGSASGG
jgi:hypothetical protein